METGEEEVVWTLPLALDEDRQVSGKLGSKLEAEADFVVGLWLLEDSEQEESFSRFFTFFLCRRLIRFFSIGMEAVKRENSMNINIKNDQSTYKAE